MRKLAFAAVLATAGAISAYAQDVPTPLPDPTAPSAPGETTAPEAGAEIRAEKQSIAELAMADERFATLVQALQASGLDETLQGSGPYTVFAPTNEAFAAEGDAVAAWLEPANKEALTNTLSYHVVAGTIRAEDLAEGTTDVPTLQGGSLTVIKAADGTITVDGAQVAEADIMASNGVIHAIDKVVTPKTPATQ